MSEPQKNALSHRGRAARVLWDWIREIPKIS